MENTSKAREAFGNGRYEESGDFYTQAAYASLSHDAIAEGVDGQIAAGLSALLYASYGYRRSGEEERAKNRCRQGILVASDLRDNVCSDGVRKAILTEYVGDFETVGDVSAATATYEQVAMEYADTGVESSFSWPSNPLIDKNVTFLTSIHRDADTSVPRDVDLETDFVGRLGYKRSQMRSLVETASGR